jgi:hypothetical protein
MATLLAGVLIIAGRAFIRAADFRTILAATLYVALPLSAMVCLVFLKDFHAVGRHFTPVSPVIVLAVALAVAAAGWEKSKWEIAWTAAFLLLWLVSCLEIRLAPRHRRDDYRDAAQVGRAALAERKRLWWIASDLAGEYYGLQVTADPNDISRALRVWRPAPEDLASLPAPDVVILSKPSIFDLTGCVTAYLQAHHYRQDATLPAFSIWEK